MVIRIRYSLGSILKFCTFSSRRELNLYHRKTMLMVPGAGRYYIPRPEQGRSSLSWAQMGGDSHGWAQELQNKGGEAV